MTTVLQQAARQLHQFGANVTAIERGQKGPAHQWDRWQAQRQRRADVDSLPWQGYICRRDTKRHKAGDEVRIGGIGIINGVSGWRTFDLDAPKDAETKRPIKPISDATIDALLSALGLDLDYPWVWRSGSGAGWEVAIRCNDPMPAGALTEDKREKGVFVGWPGDSATVDWHHIELRWEQCQTVAPPSIDGRGYAWRGAAPTEAPALLPIHRVISAFYAIAPPAPFNLGTVERSIIDQIKARFDLVSYAQRELGGEVEQEGREIRILGHTGLLIDPERGIWHIFGDAIGGDALDLVAYCKYRTTARNLNGKGAEILRLAGDFAGVRIPTPETPVVSPAPTERIVKPTEDWLSTGVTLADLQHKEFMAETWVVENILPEGACLLAAKYKSKKSWLALAMGLPIALGGRALGRLEVTAGRVLYLDLEGKQQRIQKRTRAILGVHNRPWPANFHVYTKWPQGDEGFDRLEQWFKAYPDTRFVVIDVLGDFRRPIDKYEQPYQYDRNTVTPLNQLFEYYHAAGLLVHHFNKAKNEDIMDSISGTTGLPSAVNTMWGLSRDPNDSNLTVLNLRGRDLEMDDPIALRWDGYLNIHVIEGPAREVSISAERRAILKLLSDDQPRQPKEIAAELDRTVPAVQQLIRKLLNEGVIDKVGYGKYAIVRKHGQSDHTDQSDQSDQSSNSDRYLPTLIGDESTDQSSVKQQDALKANSDHSDRYIKGEIAERLKQRGSPRKLSDKELDDFMTKDNPDTKFTPLTGTPIEDEEDDHATEG